MSVSYTGIGWTPHKKVYDAVIAGAVALYLGVFIGVSLVALPERPDAVSLATRALGTCAILMLHVVLWIGPLARLDRRFLPLLFNRRHLGVATFLVGLGHAALAVLKYHAFGEVNPLVSLLTANTAYGSVRDFPFETLGLVALVVLFLMAATSHDFWLRNLSARVWKWLHMLVYAAYAVLVMHVALGALQSEPSPVYAVMLLVGVAATLTLHVAAGWREAARDGGAPPERRLLDAGLVDDIPANRARVVCAPGGERIAVFVYEGKVSAVTNVCAHQGGPLGEGKVVDGCITCPWHGWQYRPGDGCSPPPFAEKIATFRVTLEGRRILVDPRALPPGTPVEPAVIPDRGPPPLEGDEFYVATWRRCPRATPRGRDGACSLSRRSSPERPRWPRPCRPRPATASGRPSRSPPWGSSPPSPSPCSIHSPSPARRARRSSSARASAAPSSPRPSAAPGPSRPWTTPREKRPAGRRPSASRAVSSRSAARSFGAAGAR